MLNQAIAGSHAAAHATQGKLTALSAADGRRLARRPTAAPVWDGLAVAGGRLLLAAQNGSVICLGKGR